MLITVLNDDMNTRKKSLSSSKSLAPSSASQSAGGADRRRLRILRLHRPATGSYGFHLRGGREHGTGFFISHVEPGTEAFAQGLRTGDQVLRVNDLNVNGALHKEVASLVRVGTEVILHVKSTGLIPVKDSPEDPLSWVLVEPTTEMIPTEPILDHSADYNKYPTSLASTGTNFSSGFNNSLQIIVSGAGKHTLGCSICKGPPEKSGIFVQRVRERGIAEEAGLRPGDQILSCNGISFHNIDFQQAVVAMKASPYLQLEVLRGAGLELVAGESSGYNSSASSETGEEHYPTSETDFKDDFTSNSLTSTLTRRLNGARDRIQLDANRDWKEIEAEWEDAEVSEKRTQLENNHTLMSQKLNPLTSLSKSFLNLSINEEEKESLNQNSPLKTCNTCSHLAALPTFSPNKRSMPMKPRSMSDLRANKIESTNFRIAMQMAADEHVSKIVIPSAPKDEQNALLRLEELSSGGSKNSTLLSTKNSTNEHVNNQTKTCSISSEEEEESRTHKLVSNHSRPDLSASLKENRQLLRCRSVPQPCTNAQSSEDSDSLLSFSSSTITLHKTESGRFTSKIQIRSSPPPPPPRENTTKLTRHHRKLKLSHHRKLDFSDYCQNAIFPPASPCTSSASSGDNHHLVVMSNAFRRQSLESLSGSSDESVHWEDCERRLGITTSNASSLHLSRIAPSIAPPPSPPPISSCNSTPFTPSIIPPPPPLPPSQVPSNDRSSFCSQILNRQQEITGAAAKLKTQEQNSEISFKKPPLPNPKKQQHEKLMEEFKRAHAMMVAKRQAANTVENTNC